MGCRQLYLPWRDLGLPSRSLRPQPSLERGIISSLGKADGEAAAIAGARPRRGQDGHPASNGLK